MSDQKKDLFYKEVEGRECSEATIRRKEKATRSENVNLTLNDRHRPRYLVGGVAHPFPSIWRLRWKCYLWY